MSSVSPAKSILKRKMSEGEEAPPGGWVTVMPAYKDSNKKICQITEELEGLSMYSDNPEADKVWSELEPEVEKKKVVVAAKPLAVLPPSPEKPKVKKLSLSQLGGSNLTEEDLIRLDGGCPERKDDDSPKKKKANWD